MVSFASANDDESTDTEQTAATEDDRKYFDERSEIHEIYWIACDANRRNGPQILKHPELKVGDTEDGVSGVVDDYRFFEEQKKDLIETITDEKDMYGLRKYREDFEEPDEDMWVEAGTDHYGIPIKGVHKIPEDEALERFDVDYQKEGIDPIYVPIIEDEGEEVVYDPLNFYEGEEPDPAEDEVPEATPEEEEEEADTTDEEEVTTVEKPELPTDPNTVMEWLEDRAMTNYSGLNKQERATLHRLRDPTRSNREIAARDDVDASKNTVRKGLIKHLGEEGYEDLKDRARQLRKEENEQEGDDYSEQMMATTSGDAETETEQEADTESEDGDEEMAVSNETVEEMEATIEELSERVEALEGELEVVTDALRSAGDTLTVAGLDRHD